MSDISDLKVLFVATEITPYAKSGGLGDVIGSLPKELKRLGADVRIVFPKYSLIDEKLLKGLEYVDSFVIRLSWRNQSCSIYTIDDETPTYLIENDFYFGREGFYGFWDDDERFAFFTKASIELLNVIEFKPDIIHFNDWQTGLGPVYLRDNYGGFIFYHDMKSVFTIHNLQYQGNFTKGYLDHVDLNNGYFTPDKLEFYGRVSFMKGGLVYADAVTTVSETYAKEIQTEEYGFGMDGLLRQCNHKLTGILNGIDVEQNDPKTDTRLFANYDKDSLENKKKNKYALQKHLGLPVCDKPLISIISRLVDQKGLDIVAVCLEELMNMDVQIVVLGTGDGRYEHLFKHTQWLYPDRISANTFFSGDLAQKIYAGSDMFLMPSLFEPCGLGQLFAMRYGTVPIVRKTGGLTDTVTQYNYTTKKGNGFIFEDYLASGLMWAVKEALNCFYNYPEDWEQVIKNSMECDFSWKASAKKYLELYLKLKDNK